MTDPKGDPIGDHVRLPHYGDSAYGWAWWSPDRRHRYCLVRRWDWERPDIGFVTLNPAGADASRDDDTVRACVRLARAWGYGSVRVFNLFSAGGHDRASLCRPAALRDAVGPDNDWMFESWLIPRTRGRLRRECVVAWGPEGRLAGRDVWAAGLFVKAGLRPWCLGVDRDGHPRVPEWADLETERVLWPLWPRDPAAR